MTPEEKNSYLLRFHRFQQSREKYFAPLILKAIRSQYETVIHARDIRAIDHIHAGEIARVLKHLYVDAGTVYGAKVRADLNQVKARMPIGFSETMKALIEAYFQTDILNQSEGITETTKNLIREVFTNAYEQGLGIDDIIVQLQDTELSRMRARLIARTETVTAANKGAFFVAKNTGLKLNKVWLAAHDSRTRHDHRIIDGHNVAMDDYFVLPGGIQMMQPGDRGGTDGRMITPAREVCNCRCVCQYQPVRENGRVIRA